MTPAAMTAAESRAMSSFDMPAPLEFRTSPGWPRQQCVDECSKRFRRRRNVLSVHHDAVMSPVPARRPQRFGDGDVLRRRDFRRAEESERHETRAVGSKMASGYRNRDRRPDD